MTPDSHLHDRTPPDDLLARVLSGEAGPVEREWVARWAAGDPARGRMLEAMRAAWAEPARGLDAWDAPALGARFHARLAAERRPVVPLFVRAPRRRPYAWLAAAAAVILVAGLALRDAPAPRQTASAPAATADSSRFATRRGQRATITLTDGSKVTLGPTSRLSLAPTFATGERTVVLDGEAFFEVTHDETRPFVVHTASSVTRVVGTAFGVRERAGDGGASIAVERGRVAIGTSVPTAYLGAGDIGEVTPGAPPAVRHDPLAVAARTSWKDGVLTLVDAPLDEAAATLARWYDIDVVVADAPLRHRRISVSLRDETPSTALQSIADAVDARVDWTRRTATFHSR